MRRAPVRLALLTLLAACASGAAAQGRLAFDGPRHDFGTIDEGLVATHTFRFVNAGDAPVSIAGVQASCGCTTPSYTEGAVAPGEAGEIVVAYASAGRPGPFEKRVRVEAEGAEPVTLRIAGVVAPAFAKTGAALGPLVFDRQTADVGAVRAGDPVQVSFRFLNAGERPVRIARVQALAEGVDVVFPDRPVFVGATGGLFVVLEDVGGLAGAAGGPFDVGLEVWTADADAPVGRLRVVGVVEPAGAGGP